MALPSWRLRAITTLGDRRRTSASPTRSGPEGSSRNEFPLGSMAGLPPFPLFWLPVWGFHHLAARQHA